MADAARKLDESRVRAALARVLAPALVDQVVQEASGEDVVDRDVKPREDDYERAARALARHERRRR